jgi:NIMA (never in mitosis gene a)-related kinase
MDKYELLEVIGSGSFGMIRKIRRKRDNKILVRKEIDFRKMNEKERKQLVTEVNILRDLHHPNIVKYYERIIDKENCLIYIIMEYCEGGDLAALIQKCRKDRILIPERFIWFIFTQLILALHECHYGTKADGSPRPAILHRDLKPDNVFLSNNIINSYTHIKLGDFGLARIINNPETDFAKTYAGTPYYMSPELINEQAYNNKSDIWSLGCLIYELCALEPPFQAKTQILLAKKIKEGKVLDIPKEYSQDIRQLIRSMLNVTLSKRPSTIDFLKSEKVRSYIYQINLEEKEIKLKHYENELKQYEKRIKNKEKGYLMKERELEERERIIKEKEKKYKLLEENTHKENKENILFMEYERVLRETNPSNNNSENVILY